MFVVKNYLFVYLFVIGTFVQSNKNTKKSWTKPTPSSSTKLLPNLEPDYPKFTPFDNSDVEEDGYVEEIMMQEEIDQKTKTADQPAEETLVEKLMPFTDYMFELYKVYKSSHVKEKLRERVDENQDIAETSPEPHDEEEAEEIITTTTESYSKNIKRKRKKVLKYNVGPGVNVSLDVPNEVVKVHLDEECLKDVFTGRGKKKELITKTLALFILPFLIQSSFVPFMLATIKMLLLKSLVVGKIAILLLVIAAFKNHKNRGNDMMPYYLEAGQHHRRSENYSGFPGYTADGHDATFIT